jgi:hypothetical protein
MIDKTPKKDVDPDAGRKAVMQVIEEQKKKDPLAAMKIGAQEVIEQVMLALKTEHGLHVETLFTVIAAMAGFSCQMAAREKIVANKVEGEHPFMEVKGENGTSYFFGDMINRPLLESRLSVWQFAGGGAEQAGAKTLPDIHEIATHVAGSVGKESFGVPRVPEEHRPAELPMNLLVMFWTPITEIIKPFCNVEEYPMLFGLALNRLIVEAKDVINPEVALKLTMETAIPMSKIDPSFLLPSQH